MYSQVLVGLHEGRVGAGAEAETGAGAVGGGGGSGKEITIQAKARKSSVAVLFSAYRGYQVHLT